MVELTNAIVATSSIGSGRSVFRLLCVFFCLFYGTMPLPDATQPKMTDFPFSRLPFKTTRHMVDLVIGFTVTRRGSKCLWRNRRK
jgi:hypothetical protein